MFDFLVWISWNKTNNTAAGTLFYRAISDELEDTNYGDYIFVILTTPTPTVIEIGDYVIKNDDGTVSVMGETEFEALYKISEVQ